MAEEPLDRREASDHAAAKETSLAMSSRYRIRAARFAVLVALTVISLGQGVRNAMSETGSQDFQYSGSLLMLREQNAYQAWETNRSEFLREAVIAQWRIVADQPRAKFPKLAALMDESESAAQTPDSLPREPPQPRQYSDPQ